MKVKILLFIFLFQSPAEASLPLNGAVIPKSFLTSTRHVYDLENRLIKVASLRSQVSGSSPDSDRSPLSSVRHGYDKLNQLISVKYSDKRKEGFIYDLAGNRINDRFIRNHKYNAAREWPKNS